MKKELCSNIAEFFNDLQPIRPLDGTYCNHLCPFNTNNIHSAFASEKRVCELFFMSMYIEKGGKNKRTEKCLKYFSKINNVNMWG